MKSLSKNGGKLLLSVCEIIIGVLLFINPNGFTSTIIRAAGVVLAVVGIIAVVRYFKAPAVEASVSQGLVKALSALAVGLFCIFKADWFIRTFPIITIAYGIVIVFTGLVRIQWTVDMLRLKLGGWYIPALGAVLSLAFGILIVADPFVSTDFLWKFVATALIVNAAVDIVTVIFAGSERGEISND